MQKRTALVISLIAWAAMSCSSSKQQAPKPSARNGSGASAQQTPADTVPKKAVNATELVRGDLRDLVLILRRVHFAFDSDALTPASQTALGEAGEVLARHGKVEIYVEGHADERGTTEYNLGLGERRANAVVNYLTNLGVSPSQLNIISYGEERPLLPGSSPTAWSKNRRVDFTLIRGEVQLVIEEGDLLDDRGNPLTTGETASIGGTAPGRAGS